MIFKKIGNMENVEAICHYFQIISYYYYRNISIKLLLKGVK